MADLVGDDVGLGEIAPRAELLLHHPEEVGVEIDLLVVRAVERPHRRLGAAAGRRGLAAEEHQLRLACTAGPTARRWPPDVLGVGQHHRDELPRWSSSIGSARQARWVATAPPPPPSSGVRSTPKNMPTSTTTISPMPPTPPGGRCRRPAARSSMLLLAPPPPLHAAILPPCRRRFTVTSRAGASGNGGTGGRSKAVGADTGRPEATRICGPGSAPGFHWGLAGTGSGHHRAAGHFGPSMSSGRTTRSKVSASTKPSAIGLLAQRRAVLVRGLGDLGGVVVADRRAPAP